MVVSCVVSVVGSSQVGDVVTLAVNPQCPLEKKPTEEYTSVPTSVGKDLSILDYMILEIDFIFSFASTDTDAPHSDKSIITQGTQDPSKEVSIPLPNVEVIEEKSS